MVRQGEGELVVARRPTTETSAECFVPCTSCLIFCHKDSLSMHLRKCLLRQENQAKSTNSIQEGLLLLQTDIPESDTLDAIIDGMKEIKENEGSITLNILS